MREWSRPRPEGPHSPFHALRSPPSGSVPRRGPGPKLLPLRAAALRVPFMAAAAVMVTVQDGEGGRGCAEGGRQAGGW